MMKQNHHDKILSTALSVFHEHGFHNSGTQDIVNLAGVSKGSFYNHFKSKDALGLAALDLYWENNTETRRLLQNSEVSALERLEQYLKATEYSESGCMIGNFAIELANSDMFRVRISEILKMWIAELAVCISDGQKEGSIRKDESATNLAEYVASSLEGAILKAKVDRDPKVLERFRHSITLFLKKT